MLSTGGLKGCPANHRETCAQRQRVDGRIGKIFALPVRL
ncbi:hypothetical protein CA54_50920 [Symmachiella macrocystis]|uniref:Uncharacterized protein n=1 Tax=Symmachiella macrocystis TaxID=2527985 RepID=A0A5C6B3G1_9PLAN|nr:hypothetical protein CA54_50920 [Symmachiella macrocystis]